MPEQMEQGDGTTRDDGWWEAARVQDDGWWEAARVQDDVGGVGRDHGMPEEPQGNAIARQNATG